MNGKPTIIIEYAYLFILRIKKKVQKWLTTVDIKDQEV